MMSKIIKSIFDEFFKDETSEQHDRAVQGLRDSLKVGNVYIISTVPKDSVLEYKSYNSRLPSSNPYILVSQKTVKYSSIIPQRHCSEKTEHVFKSLITGEWLFFEIYNMSDLEDYSFESID